MTATPHDALFKSTFSQVEHAASILRALLPAPLSAAIDWSTLEVRPGSFIDEALADRHTDLLFSVRIAGRDARIHVLYEHQSTPDPLMPFRVLRYVVRIWEAGVRAKASATTL